MIQAKVVLWHLSPVLLLSSFRVVSSLISEAFVLNVESAPALEPNDVDYYKEEEEYHVCPVSGQINITHSHKLD